MSLKIVVNVKSKEEYNRVLELLGKDGYHWGSGADVFSKDLYVNKPDFCLVIYEALKKLYYGHVATYADRIVYSFKEFMLKFYPGQKYQQYADLNSRVIDAIKQQIK